MHLVSKGIIMRYILLQRLERRALSWCKWLFHYYLRSNAKVRPQEVDKSEMYRDREVDCSRQTDSYYCDHHWGCPTSCLGLAALHRERTRGVLITKIFGENFFVSSSVHSKLFTQESYARLRHWPLNTTWQHSHWTEFGFKTPYTPGSRWYYAPGQPWSELQSE